MVGTGAGKLVGAGAGSTEGDGNGRLVGASDIDGERVGLSLGSGVGAGVGTGEGAAVGDGVGRGVGLKGKATKVKTSRLRSFEGCVMDGFALLKLFQYDDTSMVPSRVKV